MSASNDIAVPTEWTLFYGTGVIVVLAVVVVGIVWSLRHSPAASTTEKIVWAVIQVILPIIGFVLWLMIATRAGKRPIIGADHSS